MPTVPHRILVTGAAGAVGRAVCRALGERGHAVRGFDRSPAPELADFVQGDLAESRALGGACDGVDTIIHLAANPTDAPFLERLVPDNIVGTWRVFEAAALRGVGRVIFASTLQVVDGLPREPGRSLGVDAGTACRNLYAATKVLGEEIARVYAHRHGLSTLAARIGWLPRGAYDVETLRRSPAARDIYLGRGDCGRFFCCAVEATRPAPGESAVLYATSLALGPAPFDPAPAERLIGYAARERWPEGLGELG
ncbi:MAG: NAD(P)-dependent oxidoreductase [Spirochaetes bacterium]|nr:NAD(P)-dependent oxidoreductase [Spirochaetota bacterium]